jgi:hypothetical protein
MENRRSNPNKIFVKVRADHEIGGMIQPLFFKAEDSEAVKIDKIIDIRQAPSLKAGGQGLRFTCRVEGREVFLFHDRDEWFIEKDS